MQLHAKLERGIIMKLKTRLLGIVLSVTAIFTQCGLNAFAESPLTFERTEDIIYTDGTAAERIMRPKIGEAELKYSDIPVSSFQVGNLLPDRESDKEYTDWWYSEWDDCRYVFLPSTADRSDLVITYSADGPLCLNGQEISTGESTDILGSADTFDITVGGKDCGRLKIMQSNLGCIFLTTTHGNTDALDSVRFIDESADALMINADGGTEYEGPIPKFSAHGNSSWDYSKKKPYNIKLPQKENLYGMGKAKKWALLSNYLDHSMLRNKLTEEMCRAAGMEYVMDSVFVDLYAGGSYRGTYQLYERVQIQKNRVNIRDLEEETEDLNSDDLESCPQVVVGAANANEYMENSYKYYDIPNDPEDITGGYLMQFQLWNRYGFKCKSAFITSRGQAVGIEGPEYASKAQVEYIRGFVQDTEDAIYSDTGFNSKGKHYSDYIDVDSLIAAYLVQEISMNIDGTQTSFYLWKDSDLKGDGKLHFSPAWDFDLSYNNFITSRFNSDGKIGYSSRYDNLFAASFPISGYDVSGRPTVGVSWVGQLFKDAGFTRQVAEVYSQRFEPFLRSLTEGEEPYLMKMADDICPSAEMSNARWHTYGGSKYCVFGGSSGATFIESADIVRKFILNRKNWLTELWEPYTHLKGDVNADDKFDIADVVLFQKWLLKSKDTKLPLWQAADIYDDGQLDIFDLTLMKKELIRLS